jgi:hypothetical protein
MRISRVITATIAAVLGAGTGTIAIEAMKPVESPSTAILQRLTSPPEDSPRFDCRKHGNRTCGVRLDPTPNDGVKQQVRINVVFNKKGQPIDAYPFGGRR